MKELLAEEVESYLQQTLSLAEANVRKGGGPFAAIIVQGAKVIGTGINSVTVKNDPTAHAEILAIREACKNLGNFSLADSILFASCEPCPMCLGAIYWARIPQLYFAAKKEDAAAAGFDDSLFWREMSTKPSDRLLRMKRIEIASATNPFKAWSGAMDKTPY